MSAVVKRLGKYGLPKVLFAPICSLHIQPWLAKRYKSKTGKNWLFGYSIADLFSWNQRYLFNLNIYKNWAIFEFYQNTHAFLNSQDLYAILDILHLNFHWIGPLHWANSVSAMSICVSVCLCVFATFCVFLKVLLLLFTNFPSPIG